MPDCACCKFYISNADVCLPDYCRYHRVELGFCPNGAFGNYCDNYIKDSAMKKFTFCFIAPNGQQSTYSILASNQGIAIARFKKLIKYRKIVTITKSDVN